MSTSDAASSAKAAVMERLTAEREEVLAEGPLPEDESVEATEERKKIRVRAGRKASMRLDDGDGDGDVDPLGGGWEKCRPPRRITETGSPAGASISPNSRAPDSEVNKGRLIGVLEDILRDRACAASSRDQAVAP